MATIVNLTPRAINIIDGDGNCQRVFEPSGIIARASQSSIGVGEVDGIQLVRTSFGAPVDLPEPTAETFYIVSLALANAAKASGRITADLLLTSDPVRNDAGQIIGCRRFALL